MALFLTEVLNFAYSYTDLDGTAERVLWTPSGAEKGGRINQIIATSDDDTSAHTFRILLRNLGTTFLIGEITVPIEAGVNGNRPLNILDPAIWDFLNTEDPYLALQSDDSIRIQVVDTAVTSGKTVTFIAWGGVYSE